MQAFKNGCTSLIASFFITSLSSSAIAQSPELLRPETLVSLALEHNPDLSLSRADLIGAKAAQGLAAVLPNPRIEIGLGRESARLLCKILRQRCKIYH